MHRLKQLVYLPFYNKQETTVITHMRDLPRARSFLGMIDFDLFSHPKSTFHEFYSKRRRQLGDMYILSPSIFGRDSLVVNTPSLISELSSIEGAMPVRRSVPSTFHKAKSVVGLKLGLLANGEEWKRIRDPLSKRFLRPKLLSKYIPKLAEIANNSVDVITDRQNSDEYLSDRLANWTINSAHYLLFHRESDLTNDVETDQFIESIYTLSRSSLDLKWSDWRQYLPNKEWNDLIRAFHVVIGYTKRQMELSRDSSDTLLEYLNNETDFDELDVLDTYLTFLGASVDATLVTTLWLWYNLSKHTDVQAKLFIELSSVIGDSRVITADHYNQLHYLKMCVKESMRLIPTAPTVSRVVTGGRTLGGVCIPDGTRVIADLYGVGRDERFWEDPLEFKPDRWVDRKGRNAFSSIPFGVGPRMCIGRRIAEIEIQLLTAQLIRRCCIKLEQEPVKHFEVMIVPKGLKLSFQKR